MPKPHEAVLDLSKAECPVCERVGYCDVAGNQEDSEAWCTYCRWEGQLASILEDDADASEDSIWHIDVIRSEPKPEPKPRVDPDYTKGIPGRLPVYAETTEAERRRWRLEATKGLCTEDPKKYISGVHLSVDEMVRLLNDADRAADIAMLSNGTLAHITGSVLHSIVESVLQHLRHRRPFKFALQEMAEEAAEEYNRMRELMRRSVRQELVQLWDRENG